MYCIFKSSSARTMKLESQLYLGYCNRNLCFRCWIHVSLIFVAKFTVFWTYRAFYLINVKVLRLALVYELYLKKFKFLINQHWIIIESRVLHGILCFRCWISLVFFTKFTVFWTYQRLSFAFSSGLWTVSEKWQVLDHWNLNTNCI